MIKKPSIQRFIGSLMSTSCVLQFGACAQSDTTAQDGEAESAIASSTTRGDVNGDGLADIALTGGFTGTAPWSTIPVAYSNGNGTFSTTNFGVADFPTWATQGSRPVGGDFNGDGVADIALTGGFTGTVPWTTLPVAFSNRNGTFRVTNIGLADFPTWATQRATPVTGDFNGDGRTDIALVGGFTGTAPWTTVPVAFSNGDGSFRVTNIGLANFPTWATQRATPVSGDFNGDGLGDIALTGGFTGSAPWTTVPVAFSNGDGSFRVTNIGLADFPTWATQRATPVSGDFNGDGLGDIALTGGFTGSAPWTTLPVAFSRGDGSFSTTNVGLADFPTWATQRSHPVGGDFNGDGVFDIALTGGFTGSAPWTTLPVAFSRGDGSFSTTNVGLADFPTWATQRATPVGGY